MNLKLLLLPVFEENCDPDFFEVVSGLNLTYININGKNTKRILPCEYVEWFNIIVKDIPPIILAIFQVNSFH